MKFINWTNLPRWSSRMATARSCLPPTATQEQRSALATCLEIGFQLGVDVLRDDSRPLLTVSQGRYTHLALLEQLGHLPTKLRVIPICIEIPTPALPSLSIEEGVVEVEGRVVLADGEIRQVHLLIGHRSINSFASPQDEARFKMAIGMVSLDERNEELITGFRHQPTGQDVRSEGTGGRGRHVLPVKPSHQGRVGHVCRLLRLHCIYASGTR